MEKAKQMSLSGADQGGFWEPSKFSGPFVLILTMRAHTFLGGIYVAGLWGSVNAGNRVSTVLAPSPHPQLKTNEHFIQLLISSWMLLAFLN